MSEDSDSDELRLPPGHRIRKVTVLSSTSDSESDDGVVAASTRRKRKRVVSDDSDSSGGAVVRARPMPRQRGSPNIFEASEDKAHNSNMFNSSPSTRRTSGFASDSSEGNSDRCSICLMRFTDQEIGTPQTCEHIFCLDCITEWANNVNTCPVDRLTFNFIVVRECAGGVILRTIPINLPTCKALLDDTLPLDSETMCEICGRTDNEETMLLCDGCDLGYHMQCLTPPFLEIPTGEWRCPYCQPAMEELLEDDNLLLDDEHRDFGLNRDILVSQENVSSSQSRYIISETLTSGDHRRNRSGSDSVPSTSRDSMFALVTNPRYMLRNQTQARYASHRRKYKRLRTKTVIIEYEDKNKGQKPIVKKIKRKIKKRISKKRRPRTAARRAYVRDSVRAQLAILKMGQRQDLIEVSTASHGVQDLSVRRQRAGIPSLSLLGNPNQLDYFSDDEHDVSEGASTAIAVRPTSSVLEAYRQARRKIVTIPSPPHATSAPDLLSSILESQTLLHSKKSVLSITVDGNVNIKLVDRPPSTIQKKPMENKQERRLNLSKGAEEAKQAPSYQGHSRSGGGWGGGYRGNYHREQGATGFGRGSYNDGNYPGGPRQGNQFGQHEAARREQPDAFADYARRPHRYPNPPMDESHLDRNRRYSDSGRGFPHDAQPPWRPYGTPYPARLVAPPIQRHSFGGFDDPLDMRTGAVPSRAPPPREPFKRSEEMPACRPLPDPPVFGFDVPTALEKSEDERSDPDLVIDTDKYDPTEPTHDDDSADEEIIQNASLPLPPPFRQAPSLASAPPEMPQESALRGALAGLDVSVSPAVLDSAVRQVLHEHRDLLAAPPSSGANGSDGDSDGDCPNFSIYSATSVHIANNTNVLAAEEPRNQPLDDLEDLVQEDDDGPLPTPNPTQDPVPRVEVDKPTKLPSTTRHYNFDVNAKKKSEEYKEKVSKRCPITTNTRNPIKIKLNTPSLIKRPVSLYDEDEEVADADATETDVIQPETTQASTDNIVTIESQDRQKLEANLKIPEMCETPKIIPVQNKDSDTTSELNSDKYEDADRLKTDDQQSEDELPVTSVLVEDVKREEPQNEPVKLNRPVKDTNIFDNEESSDNASELNLLVRPDSSPTQSIPADRNSDIPEKMTESISETEDERSYTPCLDENKSKDTSIETEKDKGIEGLDTEMISEDEGNEMFSDEDRARSEISRSSPPPLAPITAEEEPPVAKKEAKPEGEPKKKKKKDSKKEGKDRGKTKRKSDVAFRKLSKSGKGRNYRERDKEAPERERRGSTASGDRDKRKRTRKEKRKDLERYDVRTVVGEKRRKRKDPFGRDVSPRARSRSPSLSPPRLSLTPRRRSPSPRRRSPTPRRRSPTPRRRSPTPRRRSTTPRRRSPTPRRMSPSLRRRSPSLRRRSPASRCCSPSRARHSTSGTRRSPTLARRSPSVTRASPTLSIRRRRSPSVTRPSPSPVRVRRSLSQRSSSPRRRVRRIERRVETRRRRSVERTRKRRRSASGSKSPRLKPNKRKKRARSERASSRQRKSPRRRRMRRRSVGRVPEPSPVPAARPSSAAPPEWSPASVESRLLSPCTPPPAPEPEDALRRRRDPDRGRHRRARDAGGASKEVFTSGDNILVSVSFKEQESAEGEERRTRRRERRRRRRRAAAPEQETAAVRPVAIIDLERSPFRELTPSPRDVIVLSDSEGAEREASEAPAPQPQPQQQQQSTNGTVPDPAENEPTPTAEERGPTTPPEPPDSPDAYDPYEPTRSASGSPAPAPSPPRTAMTLEAAQKTNMSADEVIDRRPLSPIEKVMALLQSTREVSPEPPPQEPSPADPPSVLVAPSATGGGGAGANGAPPSAAPPVRIVLPEPSRSQAPKLFLAKPSPIKSDPIKPMPKPVRQAATDSPYSPGSSDFGELFSPPGGARRDPFDALMERAPATRRAGRSAARSAAARVPVRYDRKQGRTQVGIKIDEDNLKILDDLPSSAVEMQVKSKFLKKLNRQERVVEEVKLVLKPHYNKKHVTKDEYKDILRRAVPKICHNKSGEINPTKIQALVEAYVKKIRKKHKLGLL